jgi:hypothetical protein
MGKREREASMLESVAREEKSMEKTNSVGLVPTLEQRAG